MMEKVLIVCKPSGKDALGSVVYFLMFVVVSIIQIVEGFRDPLQWLWLLLTLPASVIGFFAARYDFFGEQWIGIDGTDLIIKRVNGVPFVRDTRIPLLEIKEIGVPKKSKLDEILEAINELNMHPIDESSIEIVTIKGKEYYFGDNLSPQRVDYFIHELVAEIAKLKYGIL